jgi:hypothetical protein
MPKYVQSGMRVLKALLHAEKQKPVKSETEI